MVVGENAVVTGLYKLVKLNKMCENGTTCMEAWYTVLQMCNIPDQKETLDN